MPQVTKDTIIADILSIAPQSAHLLQSIGMHCLGCVMANGETLEQACAAHGADVDKLLSEINATI